MSILSPVALSILSNIQPGSKADGNADGGSFLTLLESAGGQFTAGADEQQQALVDMLYQAKDEPQPVAVPVEAKIAADEHPVREAVPEAKAPAVKREDNAQSQSKQPESAAKNEVASPQKAPEREPVAKAGQDGEVETDGESSLSDKLRAKIGELSDLLAAIAAMLGVGGAGQVSIVQVTTRTTLTLSQQNLQVNQPFADLSNRFDQLLAAVTDGKNLPAGSQQPLQVTFSSFKSLVFPYLNGTQAPSLDTDATLPGEYQAFSDGIKAAFQSFALTGPQSQANNAGGLDTTALSEKLFQLQAWLDDFNASNAFKSAFGAGVNNAGASGAQTETLTVSALPKIPSSAPKTANENTPAVTAVTAPQVQAATLNNGIVNAAIAAAGAVEGAANTNANLSGGNSGGQGGERPQTAGITTGAAAGATASSTASASFSKALKAASPPPVAEQVAFNIKTAVKNGASKIQIHLDPIELGKLHIKMDLSGDGKASNIVITAENKETLAMLQRDARGLENALADAGIKAESGSLSFNLQGGNGNQDDARQKFAGSYAPPIEPEDELAPLAVISRSYVLDHSEGLNIKI